MLASRPTNAHRVILLGRAPYSGKTTTGQAIAAELGIACISIDDLRLAASAVTNPQDNPGLHVMNGVDYRDYYAQRTVEQLIADASQQHREMWPAISAVIQAHTSWAQPAVLEGWGVLPDQVAQLPKEHRPTALWMVAREELYESRLRTDKGFGAGASQPDRLREHYLARTLWFDTQIREQAQTHGSITIEVQPHWSPTDVTNQCVAALPKQHDG